MVLVMALLKSFLLVLLFIGALAPTYAQLSVLNVKHGKWPLVGTSFPNWKKAKNHSISFTFMECEKIRDGVVVKKKVMFSPSWVHGQKAKSFRVGVFSRKLPNGRLIERTPRFGPRVVIIYKEEDLMILGFNRFAIFPKGIDVVSMRPVSCEEIDNVFKTKVKDWRAYDRLLKKYVCLN
jgi:hypothetical protein